MGGLAESLHPVRSALRLGAPGVGWVEGSIGLLTLVVVGLAMTAVMQSSTASIAVTISAFYAGAVGLEQGAALIIGQNIGTATSSALAAIGASADGQAPRARLRPVQGDRRADRARRLSLHRGAAWGASSGSVDGTTLLAAYHTAYNVVGVAVLLPATQWFTRFVERLLPSKESPIERALDPAALGNPVVAVEAARRVVAEALSDRSRPVARLALRREPARPSRDTAAPAARLRRCRTFCPNSRSRRRRRPSARRMTSALHALDHASRLAEILEDDGLARPAWPEAPDDLEIAELCEQAMRWTQTVADSIRRRIRAERAAPSRSDGGASAGSRRGARRSRKRGEGLGALLPDHRAAALASVAPGHSTAAEAFARIDAARRLDRIAHHAWRSIGASPRPEAQSRDRRFGSSQDAVASDGPHAKGD